MSSRRTVTGQWLREKGGAQRGTRRRHHNLEEYPTAISTAPPARAILGRCSARSTRTGQPTCTVLPQTNAYSMIGRHAASAGIATKLGNYSFRATGIMAYLKTRSKRRRRCRTTPRRAPRSSMIAGATSSASMSSSGLRFKNLGVACTT
jgi:hypothetical protein